MAGLKALAKETAIYGMSSIIGRFLNYLLVPIYTNALPVESGGYGIITNMYAITALLMVLLTYGMETGFFRFANKGVDDPMRVYSTTLRFGRGDCALVFNRLSFFSASHSRFLGIWRASVVYGDDADCSRNGRFPSYSFCLFAI